MPHSALIPFTPPLAGTLGQRASSRRPSRHDAAPKGLVHKLALAMVFLAVALSGLVFSEPAPVDALNIALIVGLPLVGLVAWKRMLAAYLGLWLAIAASGFLAATMAWDTPRATLHFAISLYLYLTAFVFAGFVARSPLAHARLILNAYLVAALIAATAGVVGYFELVAGSAEVFTLYSRASGTFKDPNVFGAFLVPALVYAVHLWLERPIARALPLGLAGGLLALGVLLSFSRGAWAASAVALLGYWYFSLAAADSNRRRLRLLGLPMVAALGLAGVVVAALQSDAIERLLAERAALTQTYDEGSEGRFGGQFRALEIVAQSPFGIGALEFTPGFHVNGMMMPNRSEGRGFGDDPHNSYLSMFLNAGWLAGILNIVVVVLTLALGARHALRRTPAQPLFIVAFVSVATLLLEGAIIDIDHWRHLHLLLGLVWGLMAGDRIAVRPPRIVSDRRPVLMRPLLVIPPTHRTNRIVRELVRRPPLRGLPGQNRRPALPRRQPRIAARS